MSDSFGVNLLREYAHSQLADLLSERDATIERLTAQVAVLRGAMRAVAGFMADDWQERGWQWPCTPGCNCVLCFTVNPALADPNPEAERLVRLKRLMEDADAYAAALDAWPPQKLNVWGWSRLAVLAAINEAVKEEE